MTTQTLTPEAERYLSEVRHELDDLNEEDRAELLEDVTQHLAAIVEEGPDTDLRARLGEPTSYANEMRVAAGLNPRAGEAAPAATPSTLRRLTAGVWEHRWVRGARQFYSDLAPGWWVLRGILIAGLPFWAGMDAGDHIPIPAPGEERIAGVTLMVLAIAASVALGKLGRRGKRRTPFVYAGAALTALVILAAFNVYATFDYILFPKWAISAFIQNAPVTGLTSQHGPVTNIHPYDSQGNPLENVLLYDQAGRPLKADIQRAWADQCNRVPAHPRSASGALVEFSYPIDYRPALHPGATVEERCLQLVPRPSVPIPTFPN